MGDRYVPITRDQMDAMMVKEMGFTPISLPNVAEVVYQRDVVTTSGATFDYAIRVFSSVDARTGVTRESGKDAIRVVLIDKKKDRPWKAKSDKRIHRTKNALPTLKERCREQFRFVITDRPKCPKCGGLMVERSSRTGNRKFLSCARFAPNESWHCDGTLNVG